MIVTKKNKNINTNEPCERDADRITDALSDGQM